MSRSKGAFERACEYVFTKDLKLKEKLIQDIIDNPEKYPPLTGQELLILLVEDYQKFVDKFKGL